MTCPSPHLRKKVDFLPTLLILHIPIPTWFGTAIRIYFYNTQPGKGTVGVDYQQTFSKIKEKKKLLRLEAVLIG